jgi:hypothetical protein
MEERYSWFDTLCILQDDLDKRKITFQGMGGWTKSTKPQSSLSLQLVAKTQTLNYLAYAAENQKSPGIIIQGLHITECGKDVDLASTLPRQRGWTYQEYQLSTRALIFINDIVFFFCKSGKFREACSDPRDAHRTAPQRKTS